MDTKEKNQRSGGTVPCPGCGEEYSTTYKRCPFCETPRKKQKRTADIDIQGPELVEQPRVAAAPTSPPPESDVEEMLLDFDLGLEDIDFTPEIESEESSVPLPPPGAKGGKRLQKGGKKGGGGKTVLFILSLLIIAAAVFIVVTKVLPIVQERFFSDLGSSQSDIDNQEPSVPDPVFALSETEVTLTAPNATQQLVPQYEPVEEIGTLTWRSDDESVVTVSDTGLLTAVGPGSAIVTVTRTGGEKAQCQVLCQWDATLLPENLKLNIDDFTIREGDPAVQLRLVGADSVEPKVTWTSSDETIITVSETGLVKRVGPGNGTITANINDGELELTCKVYSK